MSNENPRANWLNWTIKISVLCLSCCLGFGSYFCYDSPAALQSEIKHAMNLTQAEFMSLYAWYSWPNVFLCFIGGYLIDQVLGKRWGGVTFASFVLLGQVALAFGIRKKSLILMDIGRLVFGLGGETLAVVGNAYSVAWFSGSMLNLAFGAVLSVSRLGSTASLNVLEPLYEYMKSHADKGVPENIILSNVLGTAAIACILSLAVAFLLGFLDYRLHASTVGDRNSDTRPMILDEEFEDLDSINNEEDEPLLANDDSMNRPASEPEIEDEDIDVIDEEEQTTWRHKLMKSLSFSPGTWLIFSICVFFYSSVFPLISQGVEFFEKWFGVEPAEARMLNSVVYTMSLPLSPFFGLVVDRTRRNTGWVVLAVVITGTAHGLMALAHYTNMSPWVPVIMIGLGYSMLACSLWPAVSYLVPQNKLGTAYGLMQAIQNLGLALTAMLSGVIVDKGGYMNMLLFYLTFQGLALISALVLWAKHGINVDKNLPEDMRRN